MQMEPQTHHSFLQRVHTQAALLCSGRLLCHLDRRGEKVFISFNDLISHLICLMMTLRDPSEPDSLFKRSSVMQEMVKISLNKAGNVSFLFYPIKGSAELGKKEKVSPFADGEDA